MGASISHLRIPAPNVTDGETDTIKYAVLSTQGFCDKMEDAFAAFPDLDGTKSTSFFGVYDGHGGNEVALYCARQFHTELVNHSDYADNPAIAMQSVFFRMDELILQSDEWRELVNPGCKGFCIPCPRTGGCANVWLSDQVHSSTGSAACVVLIRDNKIIVGNVGDSRCILSRGGTIEEIELSTLHKPSSVHDRERIQRAGGILVENTIQGVSWVALDKHLVVKLPISRSVGASTYKQNKNLPREEQMVICNPGIRTVDITDDTEFLIIASNGMWKAESTFSVASFVRHCLRNGVTDLGAICETAANRGMASFDNVTIILIQFKTFNPAPAPLCSDDDDDDAEDSNGSGTSNDAPPPGTDGRTTGGPLRPDAQSEEPESDPKNIQGDFDDESRGLLSA